MFEDGPQYAPLPKDEDIGNAESSNTVPNLWQRGLAKLSLYGTALTLSMITNIYLQVLLYSYRRQPDSGHLSPFPQALYCLYIPVYYELP
jgi:hypothetical protein